MILTVEVRGDGKDQHAAVAFVRILGPDKNTGRADYVVGAVESAGARGGPARSAGCVVGHDHRLGIWALLEGACAELKKADFL
ncbi:MULTISPECIES: hypothetical protein [unclassified Bradyrhizobium]|uniref:hypothetical protein n=1 Tax=unclassified Bradyrhizobium TaxID=2631580 RepID=UPI001FFA8F41|nr:MULTISPECIES: hypothetical protein [unclassified Bradyrhizobium]MCK1270837.1 hypothetical protein [Bradyrhizobium sp. 84]MCK1372144.1 hypothetical protein [Bradyrhizobium sp. 49]MCK1417611.1 hypothetical protein [Bradyrhizobium sp. CW4]MCK1430585.1 hypothetical protein [Bradyrhizobium sp. 87]